MHMAETEQCQDTGTYLQFLSISNELEDIDFSIFTQ